MYKPNQLKQYIQESELRVFNDRIRVRLSKSLAEQYDIGIYKDSLERINDELNLIDTLEIHYPGNAKPILYIYIAPDTDYIELFRVPKHFNFGFGCAKVIPCYDNDGFYYAYGFSQNMLKHETRKNLTTEALSNDLHELGHIVLNQFKNTDKIISEGFAETFSFYGFGLEENYEKHLKMICEFKSEDIFSAQEIINSCRNGTFGIERIFPDKMSCSFRSSYASSYLFVRGCVEKIAIQNKLNRKQAIQFFLEMIKSSEYINEYLIYEIADTLHFPREELLNEKTLQIEVIQSLKFKMK